MWASAAAALRVRRGPPSPPPPPRSRSSYSSYPNVIPTLFLSTLPLYPDRLLRMANPNPEPTAPNPSSSSKPFSAASISASSTSRRSGRGRGRDSGFREDRHRGRGGGADGDSNRIDALGRLLTRILRHMASELNLDIRSDGFVRVRDLLKLNMTTYAKVPLRSHTVEEVKEAVKRDNKQRFSLLEENGELLIRANQGHTITTISSESLLKPILSAEEIPVCVHGTYKKNLESILKSGLNRMTRLHVHFSSGLPADGGVISGMRRDVNVLIYLDVRKALEEGMKLHISDNKVILTEGFDGVVPVRFFERIETWPGREPVPFEK
ncbi:tRNA 2'-phosphotransferase 1-like [Phoenix dactylifera]|uniref:2'-phosphotransferase n=1 Tax=Phoenix dactylifera TaxID=42345 RepID=A0A8B7D4H5_PHODC|nr:tRNA 2'-phosphotransferase 1-like [Phoenix dactylifera]